MSIKLTRDVLASLIVRVAAVADDPERLRHYGLDRREVEPVLNSLSERGAFGVLTMSMRAMIAAELYAAASECANYASMIRPWDRRYDTA
jgi:hypothetical protein